VLENAIASDASAMIAIRSSSYADRPWCRFELSRFRRPVQDKAPEWRNHWRLPPVLLVDALNPDDATRGIPELGNAPIIRWSDQITDQAERIVTAVLREALLASIHTAAGKAIHKHGGDNDVIINWLPDPTTLQQVTRDRPGVELVVHYPGRGVSGLELDMLDTMFPLITLRSFEESLP
jgi:hypothetical protein